MNFIVPLTQAEMETLAAKAKAEGTTPESLARRAIGAMLPQDAVASKPPKKTSRGILAHLGAAPSDEAIAENRKEMFGKWNRE